MKGKVRILVITYNCKCGVQKVLEKSLGPYFDIFHETYPIKLCGEEIKFCKNYFPTDLYQCQRPSSGIIDGKLFITYRMSSPSFSSKTWAKNTMGAYINLDYFARIHAENLFKTYNFCSYSLDFTIFPIDYDKHEKCDSGYTGWCVLPDGKIFLVNYIKNNAPKPYISWSKFDLKDF